jgi:hypothetical protein
MARSKNKQVRKKLKFRVARKRKQERKKRLLATAKSVKKTSIKK